MLASRSRSLVSHLAFNSLFLNLFYLSICNDTFLILGDNPRLNYLGGGRSPRPPKFPPIIGTTGRATIFGFSDSLVTIHTLQTDIRQTDRRTQHRAISATVSIR